MVSLKVLVLLTAVEASVSFASCEPQVVQGRIEDRRRVT